MLKVRLDKVREAMRKARVDAVLVTHMPNVFYLSGFTGSTAALLVTAEDSYILVDPRYSVQARAECKLAEVRDYSGISLVKAAACLINELRPARVWFEPEYLTVSSYRELRRSIREPVRLRSVRDAIERLRRTKDQHEILLIRKACEIADAAFEAVLPQIKPGLTEKAVACLIDSTLRTLGADKEAFETIAASGPNSACPHASPTDAVLRDGDLLKLDFGARRQGYNSDITRTICLGKPSAKQAEVFEIVLEAQLRAIEAIAPGKSGCE
ncbi:MAG: M24 family metallopeptidase, partial [Armatimonadota bacterium]